MGIPVAGLKHPAAQAGVTISGLMLIALVGLVDYLTGNEISFSFFYLVPIVLVTWFSPRLVGFAACGVAAAVWFYVDAATGATYSHWAIPIWNAIVRLLFFFLTTFLLGQLRSQLAREESLAQIDGLTNLLNARAFKDIASRSLQLAARNQRPVALGYIDVDNFKEINDRRGHTAGDNVLRAVAETLKGSARATDVIGRLGGDEFVVFMPEVSLAGARTAFAKVHESLTRLAGNNHWPIGFSMGIAVFPSAPVSIDEVIKAADGLMYRVKRGNKNDVLFEEQASRDAAPALREQPALE